MKNITIAKLNTLVTANAAQFTSELDKAQAIAKSKGKGINSALSGIGGMIGGALTIGAVTAFGKSVIDLGSQITDLSAQANMSQRNFQTLSVLAGDAGVSMEEVAKSSEKMRSKIQDAKDNAADPLNKTLHRLGLTAAGLAGLNTDEKWQAISIALSNAKDKQAAMNAASDIFGEKIGPKLRAVLGDVAGGLDKQAASMDGLILTDEQLKRLDDFGDKLERLGRFTKIFAVNLLDSKVGFDTLWKEAKAMAGFREQLDKNDIRNPGGFLLPGSKLPKEKTQQEMLAEKMQAANEKAWAENDRQYREELRRIAERKKFRMSDPKYLLEQRNKADNFKADVLELVLGKSLTMGGLLENLKRKPQSIDTMNTPTDAYSRIGLLTGDKVPPEQKVQTEHLKQIEDTLKKIRSILANPNSQNLAAYAN